MRLKKLHDSSQSTIFSANVARLQSSPSNNFVNEIPESESSEGPSAQVAEFNPPPITDSYRGRGRGGPMRGRGGRNGGRSSGICQVCGKPGHHALICYHRFNPSYTSSSQFHAIQNQYLANSQAYPSIQNPAIIPYQTPYPSNTSNYSNPNPQPPNWPPQQSYNPVPFQSYNPNSQSSASQNPVSFQNQNTYTPSPVVASHNAYIPSPTAAWASASPSILGPPP
ncbi:unnamed protein product [Cuscuta epithymum]|uniref:CCHC-type domain-containing protein n=1 Tax=Cuscuta epithymum TaxID=186058 RepID=A0AAV0ENG9_9ASTE|nr:unnamed protein product [Cuscuta epithymum]CAH9124348.1 unnamed protein product [Cuscuta epithymum]